MRTILGSRRRHYLIGGIVLLVVAALAAGMVGCGTGTGFSQVGQVAVGGWHTVGLKSDGTAVAVGSNVDGRCDVGDWTDIIQVAAGMNHTVGLKSDGTAVAVGSNFYGECDV